MRTASSGGAGRVRLRAVVLFGACTLIVGAIGGAKIWAAHTSTQPLALQRSLPLIVVGELLAYFAVMLWHRRVAVPLRLVLSGVALGVALRFGQACLASLVGPPPQSEGFSAAFTHYYATFFPAVLMQIGVTVLYLWLVRGAFEPARKTRAARRGPEPRRSRAAGAEAPVLAPPAHDGSRERRMQLIEALRRREAEQEARRLEQEGEAEDLQVPQQAPAAERAQFGPDAAAHAPGPEPPHETAPQPQPAGEPEPQHEPQPASEPEHEPEHPSGAESEPEPGPDAEPESRPGGFDVDERLRRQLEEARAHASAASVLRVLRAADDEIPQDGEDELPFLAALGLSEPRPIPAEPVRPTGEPEPDAEPPSAPEPTEEEQRVEGPGQADEAAGHEPVSEPAPEEPELSGPDAPDPAPPGAAVAGFDLLAAAFGTAARSIGLPHSRTTRIPGDRTLALAATAPLDPACDFAVVEELLGCGSEVCALSVGGDLGRILLRCSGGCVGLAPLLRGRRGLCLGAYIAGKANLGAADAALSELQASALRLELPHWPVFGPVDAPPAYPDEDLHGRVGPLLEWVPEVAGLQPTAVSAGGVQVVLLCDDIAGSPPLASVVAHGFRAADELCRLLAQDRCEAAVWSTEEGALAGGRIQLQGQHVIVALMRTGAGAGVSAGIQLSQILNALNRLSPGAL